MNTVAYVLRLCCGGSRGSRLPALGKAAASHQGCGERPERGTDPLPAHPEVTRAKKGVQLGCPILVFCSSPRSGLGAAGVPLSCTPCRGDAWQAPVPRLRGPKGVVYQNSEVGAVTSRSSFLWERKGTQCCVNKPSLPQVAPSEGRGWTRWESPILVPPAGVEEIHFLRNFHERACAFPRQAF